MIQKDKQIKSDLPKHYAASQYIKRLPYIENEDTNFQNKIIDLVNNRTDLQKYLLATSGYGDFIQEKINTIADDGKYNHAMVRRALDEKSKGLLQYGTPLSITFKDTKEFDIQNPIKGRLLSQVEANKLDNNILKEKLEDLKNREIASRLIGLRLPSSKNNNNNNNDGDGDSGGFGNMDFRSGKPPFLPPQRTAVPVKEKCVNDLPPSTSRTSRQKTNDLIRRFNELKKPIFRDEPLKLQSQLTDPVIESIFDNTFFHLIRSLKTF